MHPCFTLFAKFPFADQAQAILRSQRGWDGRSLAPNSLRVVQKLCYTATVAIECTLFTIPTTPMSTRTYLDFDLQIDELNPSTFRARVLNSPAGQAEATFAFPFTDQELEIFFLRIGRPRRGVRRLNSPEVNEARSFGNKLYKAVFQDALQACLLRSIDKAEQQGAGLRLRLRLPPSCIELPWEYLYDAAQERFLSHSTSTPIVRYLDLAQSIKPLAVMPPLKVLVMIASPSDYEALDIEAEWQKIEASVAELKQRGLLQLTRLPQATLSALQKQLRRDQYHIFHFIGHGGFDRQTQEGVLLLESEDGRSRLVSGNALGTLLHDHPSLRLALLNACEGARAARSDPFAGVAQQLLRQGIPAVIAMQFEITDKAAIILAREFYDALADGYPVDGALAEARKSIYTAENDIEWGTPVLYLRAMDGQLFNIATQQEATVPLPATKAVEGNIASNQNTTRTLPGSSTPTTTSHVPKPVRLPSFWRQRWFTMLTLVFLIISAVVWQRPSIASWLGVNSNSPTPTATLSTTPNAETPSPVAATPLLSPTVTPTLAAGTQMTNTIDGAVYVYVPAGKFIMGSDDGDDDEKPAHVVTLDAFWIMQTEVTNEHYKKCVDAGGCTKPNTTDWDTTAFWEQFNRHPVTWVSWDMANAYAQWAGGRLPTEAEWEKAARGPDGNVYPWGIDPPNDERLNYNQQFGATTEVGYYPKGKSVYGVLDMAGNVWERVADWYDGAYYQNSPTENPPGPASGDLHVARGGGWDTEARGVRSSRRTSWGNNTMSDLVVGFRVVRSVSPGP